MFELWLHPERKCRGRKFANIFIAKFVEMHDAIAYGHHIWTKKPYTWEIRRNGEILEVQK